MALAHVCSRFQWRSFQNPLYILLLVALGSLLPAPAPAAPQLLDDQFELPPGFHIYRAASPELAGGSYDLLFDASGRLLVGDGAAIRRLSDSDRDGVFDTQEVIATGLGWRGPQGLLLLGDRLYAVGGDGIQWFDGYASGGTLRHRGRIGQPFSTGGDHDGHTLLLGHDGWIYFMAGNGSGIDGRRHIQQANSPSPIEREASVFRFTQDGAQWECVARGGRNPPSLGMNELGDLFSFDSDMEWHVGLPWYRPVRLNHWLIGGDLGWQEVGAYPPYYIDGLPGILDVGRGSPNWGLFYEHHQLPDRYRQSFLVCDYRWKRESTDGYATSGRLVSFFLQRQGASWSASIETLARPRPDARDADQRPIGFALVDIEVAPDGSLLVSDHNQGIWRIFYDPSQSPPTRPPELVPPWPTLPKDDADALQSLLTLPQPKSERSRQRAAILELQLGAATPQLLAQASLDPQRPTPERLRALHLLSPAFAKLDPSFLKNLLSQPNPELQSYAVWLLGLRANPDELPQLLALAERTDPLVQRRALEALSRFRAPSIPALLAPLALAHSDPRIRHLGVWQLSEYPLADFIPAAESLGLAPFTRALIAACLARNPPPRADKVTYLDRWVSQISVTTGIGRGRPNPDSVLPKETRLDALRLLALAQSDFESNPTLAPRCREFIHSQLRSESPEVAWEAARLIGAYRVHTAAADLASALLQTRDPVRQFHYFQSLARLSLENAPQIAAPVLAWILSTQTGWFAEFDTKGVEFPSFWESALANFADSNPALWLSTQKQILYGSLHGRITLGLLLKQPDATATLIQLYQSHRNLPARRQIARAMQRRSDPTLGAFIRQEFDHTSDESLRGALVEGLSTQPLDPASDGPRFSSALAHPTTESAQAACLALARLKPALNESLSSRLVTLLADRPATFRAVEHALTSLAGVDRPDRPAGQSPTAHAPSAERAAGLQFWRDWHETKFGRPPTASTPAAAKERTDEDLHRILRELPAKSGNRKAGAAIYERLQCQTCHGGGAHPGREGQIFGPDLAGITRRLSRQQLADALVYPSRQVADRFKASEVHLKDGTSIVGFVTERTPDGLQIATRDQVRRIPASQVRDVTPQTGSLMPDRILAPLSAEELRDLFAYIEGIGTPLPD